jgi:alkylation response protein AidB-like acyl-CoA dehydrogenase
MVARFLGDRHPPAAVRAFAEGERRHDPALWAALAGELGATGLNVPEAHGGAGFGPVELGIVVEEAGRHLYCGPFFASAAMAGSALLAADAEAQAALLPSLADGSTVFALVLDALDDPARLGRRLRADADGVLSGEAPIVIGAEAADRLVVVAADGGGLGLFLVEPADARIESREGLDLTRPLSRVAFEAAPARRIGTLDAAGRTRLWHTLAILAAHELVGAAEALLYSTVEYMGQRMQFGRTIASFQALKHRCADLLMEVELAKAVTHEAARVLAGEADPAELAHMAKAQAGDAAMEAARAAIQLRGGIGFTWEDDTHFWYRRVQSAALLFGSPERHREWLVTVLATGESADAD